MAKLYAKKSRKEVLYLDLELESHYNRLLQDAESYLLKNKHKLVIIDEVQRMPRLFALLRALVDLNGDRAFVTWFFLSSFNSRSFRIIGWSNSLLRLRRINLIEAIKGKVKQDTLWLKGGFPIPLGIAKTSTSQNGIPI